jgi:hypothetical protein
MHLNKNIRHLTLIRVPFLIGEEIGKTSVNFRLQLNYVGMGIKSTYNPLFCIFIML